MTTFDAEPELQELTLNEIFNGCASFEGFCPVVCRLQIFRGRVANVELLLAFGTFVFFLTTPCAF